MRLISAALVLGVLAFPFLSQAKKTKMHYRLLIEVVDGPESRILLGNMMLQGSGKHNNRKHKGSVVTRAADGEPQWGREIDYDLFNLQTLHLSQANSPELHAAILDLLRQILGPGEWELPNQFTDLRLGNKGRRNSDAILPIVKGDEIHAYIGVSAVLVWESSAFTSEDQPILEQLKPVTCVDGLD